ncbi:MAG: serine protease [Lachnospiraceae bacterium]|nr:serine protease [Lachnospiraceae bacterium]
MKKSLRVFLGILIMTGAVMLWNVVNHRVFQEKRAFAAGVCVSDKTAVRAADIAAFRTAGEGELDTGDIRMQIVYQLAKRSVVKVAVKDAAGSGIIWKLEDGIVIVSNRHLLMRDVQAQIGFGSGETAMADVIGYSQQYDIGFARVAQEAVPAGVLRDIYEVVPVFYEMETEADREEFTQLYAGKRVLQLGAPSGQDMVSLSTGIVQGLRFVPLFNTNVLETEAFSRAGMSGGGVFDEGGHFMGMISGGEVPEDAQKREADITYSIPSKLIEAEYETAVNER